MTVIAAIAHRGRVFMGGDSAGVSNLDVTPMRHPKAFRLGEMVVGTAWSIRAANLVHHAFTPPAVPRKASHLMRYMVVDFATELRALHRSHGWVQSNQGRDIGDMHFLVGVRGRLFRIEGDYHVSEARPGFDAVGCGAPYALGAFFASAGTKLGPLARVKLALRAADRYSGGVCQPFTYAETPAR